MSLLHLVNTTVTVSSILSITIKVSDITNNTIITTGVKPRIGDPTAPTTKDVQRALSKTQIGMQSWGRMANHKVITLSQDFGCPIKDKKAKIPMINRGEEGSPSKALAIECASCAILSCSAGVVKNVDSSQGYTIIDIEFGHYVFVYKNLKRAVVKVGQKIRKGQKIGSSAGDLEFVLIVYKDEDLVNASLLIGCR